MDENTEAIREESRKILDRWILNCTRYGKVSRNTIAIGIVVLDHLRKDCPVIRENVISQGGEIKDARSGLRKILETYRIPSSYLKEVTTRQAGPDGLRLYEEFEWGRMFSSLSDEERKDLMGELIEVLSSKALDWLNRQNLKLNIDRRQAPSAWVHQIVENAKSRSGGVVEQHLIGAKLERRFRYIRVPNHPAHAGDSQTARSGDFEISELVYHVTAAPGLNVIQKCGENIEKGLHPILLVPSEKEEHAIHLALEKGIDKELTIISIEDFIAMNIIELATDEKRDFYSILSEIVQIYNRRLEEVETDLSLQIQIH